MYRNPGHDPLHTYRDAIYASYDMWLRKEKRTRIKYENKRKKKKRDQSNSKSWERKKTFFIWRHDIVCARGWIIYGRLGRDWEQEEHRKKILLIFIWVEVIERKFKINKIRSVGHTPYTQFNQHPLVFFLLISKRSQPEKKLHTKNPQRKKILTKKQHSLKKNIYLGTRLSRLSHNSL